MHTYTIFTGIQTKINYRYLRYVLLFFISHFFLSVHTGIRCEHGNRKVRHDMSRAAINSNTEAGVM